MDHRSGNVENYERPNPCEEQEKREGKEDESHKRFSVAGDDSTPHGSDGPALEETGRPSDAPRLPLPPCLLSAAKLKFSCGPTQQRNGSEPRGRPSPHSRLARSKPPQQLGHRGIEPPGDHLEHQKPYFPFAHF